MAPTDPRRISKKMQAPIVYPRLTQKITYRNFLMWPVRMP